MRSLLAWTPWFVLGVSLFLTGVSTVYVSRSTRDAEGMRFERWAQTCVADIDEQFETYVALLRGAAALFAGSTDVSRDEFARYVGRVRVWEFYRGMQGIGFSAVVPEAEVPGLLERVRADGLEGFEIWPNDPRQVYHTILYLEPQDERNRRSLGFDMHTEPVRREAMDRARDTGLPAMSGRVTLVQEIDGDRQAGFLVYVPVYAGGAIPATVDERREELVGFVYSPFRAEDAFAELVPEHARALVSVSVYDGLSVSPEARLYRSATEPPTREPMFTLSAPLTIAGRPWTLGFSSRQPFEQMLVSRWVVPLTLAGGLLLSLTLFGITLAQTHAQLKAQRFAAEKARSERAARESDERLRLALQAAQLLAFTWDLATDRLLLVGDAQRVLGRGVDRVQDYLQAIHPDDRAGFERSVARALAGEGRHEMEYRVVAPSGEVHWLRDRATVEFDAAGSARRMVGASADITASKEAEGQLRQLNETLEQRVAERTAEADARSAQLRALANELTQAEQRERRRLAQVLHDHLQQLLVASLMRLGNLRRKSSEGAQNAIDAVEDLIRQAITSSRSLTVELSPPVLYDAGLAKALDWLARSFRDKHGLVVDVEYDPDAPEVNEDLRAFLFQAVRELLFNVVKHSGVKEARVSLRRWGEEQLAITVEDDGPGFDPAVLRGKGAKTEHFGLFSIQQRLELLGGRMELDSAPGEGTGVTLFAPLRLEGAAAAHVGAILENLPDESDEVLAAEKLLDTYTAPAGEHGVRVLLADDHEAMRRGLGTMLHRHPDIDVLGEASDGDEAVSMAHELRPDVVVIDATTPRIDGVEATRRILADSPRTRVIGLSEGESDDAAVAMKAAGAYACQAKSSPPEELIALIREAATTTEAGRP